MLDGIDIEILDSSRVPPGDKTWVEHAPAREDVFIGQWKDEIKRFAPSLRVVRFHGSNKDIRHVH